MYGDGSLKQMFLGSGGGSGGSAKDGTKNPSGNFMFFLCPIDEY